MIIVKRLGLLCLASAALMFVGDLARDQSVVWVPSFVSDAVARVGRPLTPVSVAGVARRTTRRCAAGVYNC
jgi:hypothetical protein